jgi:hypothetical protein
MSFLAVLFAVAALDAPPSDQAPQSQALPATTVSTATATAKAPEDRVTCHTEPVTGSHFGKKVCETQAAAKARREDLRQALQRDRDQRPYDKAPPTLDGQ